MLEKAVRICDAKFGNIYRWDGDTVHVPHPIIRPLLTPKNESAHSFVLIKKRRSVA